MTLLYILGLPSSKTFSALPSSAHAKCFGRKFCQAQSSFTIRFESEFCEVIKKSKFIAKAAPARSIEEAQAYIEKVKDDKATHNCWAFRSELSGGRCSDDGEVAGTAGRPILGILEAENLIDTVLLVTRHYGGVKLGTGGLVRAYSSAAKGVIANADKVLVVPTYNVKLQIPVEHLGLVYQVFQTQQESPDGHLRKLDEQYLPDGSHVVFLLEVSQFNFVPFKLSISDVCRGREILTLLSDDGVVE